MSNFDVTSPLDGDLIRQGDDEIRQLKAALQDALRGGVAEGLEAIFPGSAPSTSPVYHYRGLKGSTIERPTSGQYGLYFDTTRQALQRDNGTTWDDIACNFPAGTNAIFYQSSAPLGWTAIAINDKFLRVVTAGTTGGTSGPGTLSPSSSLSHSHSYDHYHTVPNHVHTLEHTDSSNGVNLGTGGAILSARTAGAYLGVNNGGAGTSWQIKNQTTSSGSTTTGSATGSTTNSLVNTFAYSDVIVATKN